MSTGTTDLRAIIETFSQALDGLGLAAEPATLERWALVIHRAMTGSGRMFHTNDHVLSFTRDADPIEKLAALFHDVVYLQVDQGLPKSLEPALLPYVALESAGARVRPLDAAAEPLAGMVLELFGAKPGDLLSVYGGANELMSALLAVRELGAVIPARALAEVAACIEATIPFRGADAQGLGPMERLATRLAAVDSAQAFGMGEAEQVRAVQRAVWVANRDVENFAWEDVGLFLDNTWKLLPETNPSLRRAEVYTVTEYRTALQKMEGFLSGLSADLIFHHYRGAPDAATLAALRERASINLELSTRYLRIKLVAIAYVEALALATGGDAPLELFMGGLHRTDTRLENYLPGSGEPPRELHPTLWALVHAGRAGESSFDLKQAPLAAFLYRNLGEPGVAAALSAARRLFKGELDGPGFLGGQPPELVRAVARAASHIVATRRAALLRLGEATPRDEVSLLRGGPA